MTRSLKKRWLKALRSGEYRQCTGTLREQLYHDDSKFCALGLLCEVAKDASWYQHLDTSTWRYTMDGIFLHKRVHEDIAKQHASGLLPWQLLSDTLCDTIVLLNDQDHESFNFIADYIDDNPDFATDENSAN